MTNKGKVLQVIGPVVDVEFRDKLPEIYNALEIKLDGDNKLVLETHQHTGGNKVRAVAMGSTDGLKRGMEVVDTGAPIAVPVGEGTLGRMFNLLGEPIDGIKDEVKAERKDPIHRDA
ncbi:MAG TPA: F0F1 ATP synthase subunit beta, partial [Patescibacteria group bacterium]|nr:F0F1 ATP synthase subunit beta [Patescibacteria group bacterium]